MHPQQCWTSPTVIMQRCTVRTLRLVMTMTYKNDYDSERLWKGWLSRGEYQVSLGLEREDGKQWGEERIPEGRVSANQSARNSLLIRNSQRSDSSPNPTSLPKKAAAVTSQKGPTPLNVADRIVPIRQLALLGDL
ncbi:hypothetical protein JTE90_023152 [Oedothorax gibbosus]|uniref:Uncharacterized protein n=1 Tax=Oedothorax gibbosus TaxID=931172 RepID=A0AAV6USY1_9ARAC|nr:hypothetical protein JTE90_023152 [Oedothorax gibbosus]